MDITDLTIQKAIDLLNTNKVTQTELINEYQKRVEKYNPSLNSLLTYNSNFEPSCKGSLRGLPVVFKDMFLTKGERTTAGSKVLYDYIPQYNSTVVSKIKDEGAYIIGKANQDAWAHGSSGENSDFPPAKNPWNIDFVPGGSSSGSAAALAANFCLVAFGTDTGGSIRLPASFCNLVGLKPTYGRVSRYGVIAMASSVDSIGHMTKTVFDNAMILEITAGKDPFDATTNPQKVPSYTKNINKGIKGQRIGIPKEYFQKGIDKRIEEKVKAAVLKYEELGAEIVDVSLPNTEYALSVYYVIQPSEVSSNLARYDGIRYGHDRSSFGQEAKRRIILGTYTLSSGYYDAYYIKAAKVRTLLLKDFQDVFEKVDFLIAPVSPSLPFKLGQKTADPLVMYLSDIFTVTINMAGLPALSIPCGFIDHLPVGFQIIGPHLSEELLFQAGYAYQQVTDYHTQKPKLTL